MEAAGACACAMPLQVFGVALGDGARRSMAGMVARIREAGISADMDYEGRSLKAQMRAANRREAMCCLILGEEELGEGKIVVKNMMDGGGQENVDIFDFLDGVRRVLPKF
jgi:histidyl-tRNA synthetase